MAALESHVWPGNVRELRNVIERAVILEMGAEIQPPSLPDFHLEGRLRKYLAEITLLGQPFIKDEDITVEKLLKRAGAKVTMFARYEVGAGIEKKQDDFVGEVMAQVKAQDKDKKH